MEFINHIKVLKHFTDDRNFSQHTRFLFFTDKDTKTSPAAKMLRGIPLNHYFDMRPNVIL